MKFTSSSTTGGDWLLRGVLLVSIGIHLGILIGLPGTFRTETPAVIEFAVRDLPALPARNIPRPRRLTTPQKQVVAAEAIRVPEAAMARVTPVETACRPVSLPDAVGDVTAVEHVPVIQGIRPVAWQPESTVSAVDYSHRRDYFDMVRLLIERHKTYPESAMARQIEGRTTLRFIIGTDGSVSGIKKVKSSRCRLLDRAAMNALRAASPFPCPPSNLFDAPVQLEVTIIFELI